VTDELPTWRDVRADVARRLRDAGIESPDAEARWLTEQASGCEATEWLDVESTAPTRGAWSHVAAMCERRALGEPLQYVLGSWSFRGIDLMVDDRVLVPRPETEVVVEVALAEAQRLGHRRGARSVMPVETTGVVVDLGTGSGAIAIALEAELPAVEVWATDISEDALAVARSNVAGASASRVRLARGSWFDALPVELRGRVDVAVSNPPYVTTAEFAALPDEVARYEPRRALVAGPAGTEAIAELTRTAPRWLAESGVLVCELAPHQADEAVALALDAGFARAEVHPDLAGRARALVARLR
jgi:release factor glutamine methyltransferase